MTSECICVHEIFLKRSGVEACVVFFENLGRNKRFGSNESNVSLRQVGEVIERVDDV